MFGRKEKKNSAEKSPELDSSARKQRRNDIVAATLMVLAAALAVGSFVLAGFSIVDFFSSVANSNTDSYICLTKKSKSESEALYSKYGSKNKNKANDFALIGNKFFISESKITPSLLSSEYTSSIVGEGNVNFALSQIGGNVYDSSLVSDFAEGRYYVDLSSIEEGDYLVMPISTTTGNTADYNPYSLNSSESISYTAYTLPDEKGKRMRITIKDNSLSPFLVINVTDSGNTLPTNYYDAVCFASEYEDSEEGLIKDKTFINEETISSLSSSLKSDRKYIIKTITGSDRINSSYSVNATYSFAISNKTEYDYTSSYIYKGYNGAETKVIDQGQLVGYDYYPEIREMTGYLDQAGKSYADVIGNNIITPTDEHLGKESFLIKYDSGNEFIDRILSYLAK